MYSFLNMFSSQLSNFVFYCEGKMVWLPEFFVLPWLFFLLLLGYAVSDAPHLKLREVTTIYIDVFLKKCLTKTFILCCTQKSPVAPDRSRIQFKHRFRQKVETFRRSMKNVYSIFISKCLTFKKFYHFQQTNGPWGSSHICGHIPTNNLTSWENIVWFETILVV